MASAVKCPVCGGKTEEGICQNCKDKGWVSGSFSWNLIEPTGNPEIHDYNKGYTA